MIKSLFIYAALFFSIPMMELTQGSEAIILKAFSAGTVSDISEMLSENVQMIIMGKISKQEKAKAISCISPYFTENTTNDFKVLHKGNNGETSFLIGTFSHSGKKYRIHFLTKHYNDKDIINQIRIENNNE